MNKLTEWVEGSDAIVFFGGAGVSTESHIPDFRSANGLYQKKAGPCYSPEEILSHSFFMTHTKDFYDFYRSQMIYKEAQPNKAHLALASLEHKGKLRAVITQNIDGLHQKAGSKQVFELHGSIHRNYCMQCHAFYDLDYVLGADSVPQCTKCRGLVKPDVVLFEESLDEKILKESIEHISKAEVLIVGGTSLSVYPAAGLIHYYRGNKLVLINQSETPYDKRANLILRERIGEVLERTVR